MNELGIESTYAQLSFKSMITQPNEDAVQNLLDRNFDIDEALSVLVRDLAYVRIGKQCNYVYFFLDLYNREVVRYSARKRKDAALVRSTFASVKLKPSLGTVKTFHTARGSEFKNITIEELLSTNNIERSLSDKGNLHDNAVSEATFKILKTELINRRHFNTLNNSILNFLITSIGTILYESMPYLAM